VLLPLIFVLLLAIIAKDRWILAGPLHFRRLACRGALATTLLCAAIYATGCGRTSAVTTTPPPLVTPSGTSTITINLSAMSPTQQPLQLPPIQLTLTVK
jgi:hypothetical protein